MADVIHCPRSCWCTLTERLHTDLLPVELGPALSAPYTVRLSDHTRLISTLRNALRTARADDGRRLAW